jgi:CDP-diacylglycerol--serine O-phosphatidyltransferase
MSVVTAIKIQFEWSVFYMMVGAVLDAFDGKIARKLGVYSQFGAHLDTKADVVTFGVAPAVLIAQFLNQSVGEYGWVCGALTGIMFYGCVHYRLKRYQRTGHHDVFLGVPSPVGATVLGMVVISYLKNFPLFVMGIAIGLSMLMASTIRYPHNRLTPHIVIFNVLSKFSILFWFILLFQLLGVPFPETFHIIEITLVLSLSYLLTPILMRFSTIPDSN